MHRDFGSRVSSPELSNAKSPQGPVTNETAREINAEQEYVDNLFSRLDREVALANEKLNEVQKDVDPHTPDADALIRRETEYHGLQAKLDRLNLAQLGLVFGRIDIDAPRRQSHRRRPRPQVYRQDGPGCS